MALTWYLQIKQNKTTMEKYDSKRIANDGAIAVPDVDINLYKKLVEDKANDKTYSFLPSADDEQVEYVVQKLYSLTKRNETVNILLDYFPIEEFNDFALKPYFTTAVENNIKTNFLLLKFIREEAHDYQLLKTFSENNKNIIQFRLASDEAKNVLNSEASIKVSDLIMNFATFGSDKFIFQVVPESFAAVTSFNSPERTAQLSEIFGKAFEMSTVKF